MDTRDAQVTQLLSSIKHGDEQAADQLLRLVYDELHRLAHRLRAREDRGGDLQTTVLFQEAYVRLLGGEAKHMPECRRQFFAYAANAMRQFLVDDARRRCRAKRGGGKPPAVLDDQVATLDHDPAEILAVSERWSDCGSATRGRRLVELRYFSGLTIDETADVMELSPRQVDQEWRFTRAWLHRELS